MRGFCGLEHHPINWPSLQSLGRVRHREILRLREDGGGESPRGSLWRQPVEF